MTLPGSKNAMKNGETVLKTTDKIDIKKPFYARRISAIHLGK